MLVVLAAVTGLLGCKQEEKIARHRIEKSRSGLGSLRKTAASAPNEMQPTVAKDRMVVGLYLMDDATWFFKLTGPIKDVAASQDQWEPFLENVNFESGKPRWELPAGWSKGPAKPMRFETLVVGEFQPWIAPRCMPYWPDSARLSCRGVLVCLGPPLSLFAS